MHAPQRGVRAVAPPRAEREGASALVYGVPGRSHREGGGALVSGGRDQRRGVRCGSGGAASPRAGCPHHRGAERRGRRGVRAAARCGRPDRLSRRHRVVPQRGRARVLRPGDPTGLAEPGACGAGALDRACESGRDRAVRSRVFGRADGLRRRCAAVGA